MEKALRRHADLRRPIEEIKLEGYSGYEIFLRPAKGGYIVKKKARKLEQNARLTAQYKKHEFFAKRENKGFSVPPVIDHGYEGGLFWYSYRFIEGVTLLRFIEREPIAKVKIVLNKVLAALKYLASEEEHFELKPGAFFPALKNKMRDSFARVKEPELPPQLLKKFESRIRTLDHAIEPTLCHGDFTLDNIIVDKNLNLWLIDFMEVFYPHWWFDISKFFQDVDGGWYELTRDVQLPYNKFIYVREHLLSGVHAIDKRYAPSHSFLVALHLLRNIPFLKNVHAPELIEAKQNSAIEKISNLLES